jgi:hypothetical protein
MSCASVEYFANLPGTGGGLTARCRVTIVVSHTDCLQQPDLGQVGEADDGCRDGAARPSAVWFWPRFSVGC